MKASSVRLVVFAGVLGWASGAVIARGQDYPAPPPAPAPGGAAGDAGAPGMDVLTRGPIHEAFAQPVNTGSVQPLVVVQQPPNPIEEVPPDAKPDDPRAIWVGGYWSWADDRKDFLWVSGVWRVPPPRTQWVAGYWGQVAGGYQWTAGFWSPEAQQQVTYYPAPPASQEAGPTSALPGPNYFWISGSWEWRGDRYLWRPGYWHPAREGWVWVPDSYYWCPAGWVYCPGYWDYPLAGRGVMFAPVAFAPGYYRRPGFVYSPSVVIQSGAATFSVSLFVRPSYCHYYFGDYYAVEYDRMGIYPWIGVGRTRVYAYDPLFTYYGCYYRERDPRWAANIEGWHTYYRGHPEERPPHDMAAQLRLEARGGGHGFLTVGVSLDVMRRDPHSTVKFVAVSPGERARLHETVRTSREAQGERFRMERGAGGGPAGPMGPRQLAVPRAPLAVPSGHAAEHAVGHGAGPVAPPSPHTESKIVPHAESKVVPHAEAKIVPHAESKFVPPSKSGPAKPEPKRGDRDRDRDR